MPTECMHARDKTEEEWDHSYVHILACVCKSMCIGTYMQQSRTQKSRIWFQAQLLRGHGKSMLLQILHLEDGITSKLSTGHHVHYNLCLCFAFSFVQEYIWIHILNLCIDIYIYICVCVCIHTYIHTCMHACIHIHIYINIYTCVYETYLNIIDVDLHTIY